MEFNTQFPLPVGSHLYQPGFSEADSIPDHHLMRSRICVSSDLLTMTQGVKS